MIDWNFGRDNNKKAHFENDNKWPKSQYGESHSVRQIVNVT